MRITPILAIGEENSLEDLVSNFLLLEQKCVMHSRYAIEPCVNHISANTFVLENEFIHTVFFCDVSAYTYEVMMRIRSLRRRSGTAGDLTRFVTMYDPKRGLQDNSLLQVGPTFMTKPISWIKVLDLFPDIFGYRHTKISA